MFTRLPRTNLLVWRAASVIEVLITSSAATQVHFPWPGSSRSNMHKIFWTNCWGPFLLPRCWPPHNSQIWTLKYTCLGYLKVEITVEAHLHRPRSIVVALHIPFNSMHCPPHIFRVSSWRAEYWTRSFSKGPTGADSGSSVFLPIKSSKEIAKCELWKLFSLQMHANQCWRC